ncbi:hypothetical protein [Actinosynnema sp. NPDC023587]|uniref:hypothetical protein n=1 Tax=Actinosynnema sp. NPDC023587 TaxID=3154695 RepID=UPI0033E8C315
MSLHGTDEWAGPDRWRAAVSHYNLPTDSLAVQIGRPGTDGWHVITGLGHLTNTTPLSFDKPLTVRELARIKRRWLLAYKLGDTTVLHDDGTGTEWRGSKGWRRCWIKLRMWIA